MKHRVIHQMQDNFYHVGNSFEARKTPGQEPFELNSTKLNDLAYGTEYPNSFLDLYLHNDSETVRHPTLIIFHGGGYCIGTKDDGDGTPGAEDRFWFIRSFVEAGFNVAAPEYVYAPDYRYPTPVLQLSQAVKWLLEHAEDYHLDMDHVVLNGASAGGQLVGQFVNIQTNPDYADEMGIAPVLPAEKIKALLFNSALTNVERFGKTGSFMNNWIFSECGYAYFGVKKFKGNPSVKQAGVLSPMTAAFPPSFVSDGNTGSFADQNRRFSERMNELGIPHVLNIYPRREKKLPHGFEGTGDFYGKDNMAKMLMFLREREII